MRFLKKLIDPLNNLSILLKLDFILKTWISQILNKKDPGAMRGNTTSLISVPQRTQLLSLMEPAKWIFLNCESLIISKCHEHFDSKMLLHKMLSKALKFHLCIPRINSAENFGEKWTSYKNGTLKAPSTGSYQELW